MQLHKRKDRKTYCVGKKLYLVCNIMQDNKVKVKVKQSRYRPREAQRVPGS